MNFRKLLAVLSADPAGSLPRSCLRAEDHGRTAAATEEATVEATEAPAEEAAPVSSAPDWAAYDELIAQIKTTTDFAERVTRCIRRKTCLWRPAPFARSTTTTTCSCRRLP
jgi:hypothetical protein